MRIVFIAHVGSGNECPITAKNLEAAEIDFVRTCGLTPERAAALREQLDRNKVVSVETSLDTAIAVKFRYARPWPESHTPACPKRPTNAESIPRSSIDAMNPWFIVGLLATHNWQEAFAPTTWSNWALVIVGISGVTAAIWTLRILNEQTSAAKRAAEALISSERAWVMVDIEKQPGAAFITDGKTTDGGGKESYHTGAFVRCICSNQGKTPAKIIEKRICLLAGITPLPKEPKLDIPILDAEPYYLQSGNQSKHDWPIEGKGGRGIGNMVVIYGVVKYRHIFSDQEVQTTFGYRLTVDEQLERLSDYPKYNENA